MKTIGNTLSSLRSLLPMKAQRNFVCNITGKPVKHLREVVLTLRSPDGERTVALSTSIGATVRKGTKVSCGPCTGWKVEKVTKRVA